MTEIPEHLRKRAEEAKAKAAAKAAAAAGGDDAPTAAAAEPVAASAGASKIPAHLLERSKSAKDKAAGGGAATAVAEKPAGAAPVIAAGGAPPLATGPGGHTQRLLTVVKSGSIQDVKAAPRTRSTPGPTCSWWSSARPSPVWPSPCCSRCGVNAPFLELANFNQTPNPSKAPWYFLGLQELLTMFHPMVAGVTIPGMGLFVLGAAPFIDRNPSNKPEDRKFAIAIMTVHLMFWAVLVMIGSFFRGPGFNFVFPWNKGLFFEL